ncbi:response regulator transcription factor [Pantoea sp. B9002]|uniref:response regulator n=1 Tax=Pantoea sp. B9002 TaxID=2726979 RepID=UPI0015A25462|nr:response regulator [Pantoea sp. B9002]NWA62914.1 response regulator transcription factor [Pantoea sp. B9002]
MKRNILLIDRHPMIFHGFSQLFKDNGYHLVDAYHESSDVYSNIININPDFIIMDLHCTDMKNAEIFRIIESKDLISRLIIFSEYDDLFYQNECMALGIKAYIPKSQEPESLLLAIRAMNNGMTYYPTLTKRRSFVT